jgi:hypothetical protein
VTPPPVVLPEPPEFHPEFGYFWPASHTRRMMRIALISTVFGVLVGVIAVVAMTPRSDPDAVRAQTAFEASSTVGAATSSVGAATSATAAAPEPAATPTVAAESAQPPVASEAMPAAASVSCQEQTWPYLDGKCLKSNTRKKQQVRVLKPETSAQSASVEADAAPETTAAVKEEPTRASKKREKKSAKTRERRRHREFEENDRGRDIPRDREIQRGRYVDRDRYLDPRRAYASPYESRYDMRGGWGW